MKEIYEKHLSGERALYGEHDAHISYCTFADGESPLKQTNNLEIDHCLFHWKYPLWYAKNISLKKCSLFDMARAGIWYVEHISVEDTVVEAPKNFRRVKHMKLKDVSFPNAAETLWNCQDIQMERVTAKGDYFAMNCEDLSADHLTLVGNYSFDGCKNVIIRDSRLLSKDAFWNAENIEVYDSFISGEYLGWNSKNITLVNCTIESLQGMCYIQNLVMKNCRLINTTLAFEHSNAEVEVIGSIDSVFNPESGTIRADRIGELIVDERRVKIDQTKIEAAVIDRTFDRPEWER